jgi:hypothetical protein
VAITSNVTATLVGVVHGMSVVVVLVEVVVVVLVVLPPPDLLVTVAGQAVLVALLKVPIAEVALHLAGTLLAVVSPQGAGTMSFRRSLAVRSAA